MEEAVTLSNSYVACEIHQSNGSPHAIDSAIAKAVIFNLTVTTTAGTGFLAIAPGSAGSATTSILNWKAGVTVANSSTVGLDTSRQVRVFAGGGASATAHFIVDVLGYYL